MNTFFFLSGFETELFYFIFPDLFLVLVHSHYHLHQLPQHIDAVDFSPEIVVGSHIISDSRKFAVQILIGILLIFQAAHKPAAYP